MSGSLESQGNFVYGKKEGLWTHWFDAKGTQRSEEYRNGKLHGAVSTGQANGQARSRGEAAYGAMTGPWVFWNADGSVDEEMSGRYDRGERVGD